MAEQIKVRYSYRIEDLEDVYEAANSFSTHDRRIRRAAVVAGVLLLCSPFLAGGDLLHPEQFLLGMSPFGICLIWWGLQSARRNVREYYTSLISGSEYEVTIADDGIVTQSPTVRTDLKWAAFSQVIKGKQTLALVYEAVMYLFPKRAFSPDQWDEFLALVHERVTPPKSS